MRTFSQWLEWHHYAAKKSPVVTPQYPQVWVSIRDAERKKGISYGELAGNITLEKDTLDSVIAALVNFGKVAVSMERGQRIYRPR
jgi:ribosome-binding protein aMBF1 (putative translation factor)